MKQKNTEATEKAPTKAQKQEDEIKKYGKIPMWFVSDIEPKGGSSNANDVNETIPVSNNPVTTIPTLVGRDSIVTDDIKDPNLQVSSSNVNETIPVSNNPLMTSPTLVGHDSIVTDTTTTTTTTTTTITTTTTTTTSSR